MNLYDKCASFTEAKILEEQGFYPYFRVISSEQDTEVIVNGKKTLMLGSNSYLGLTNHPKVKEAAENAIKKYGTGCAGSRFLNGTLDIHIELEDRLADLVGMDSALAFSTGYQANLGVLSTIVTRGEYFITDKLDHASIIDGCHLSYGKMLRYNHNDMDDLERVLRNVEETPKLIVVDGIFSMEGDIAKLPQIVHLAEKYNAQVMVDDAHSIGVLGKNGAGTSDHFGLTDKVDIIMGTFSKSLASLGGFIAADELVIHYIKHHARALIFSASMPPSAVATVLACLDIIESEPERLEMLWKNTRKMKEGYDSLGFDTGASETAIIPIKIGEDEHCFAFWKLMFDNGIFANPAVSPAVPPHEAIIRTSYMATHTDDELDKVLDIFSKLGKQFGII